MTPPAPRRIAFPAIRLLLGLTPREETPARTPWWLILLRTVLAALIIIALAHPLLNPQARLAGAGAVALVIDDGWPAARDWSQRQAAAIDILAEARREDRQIVLVTTAPLASRRAGAAARPDPRRRRARGGAGAAAEAVARRPAGGADPARGDAVAAGQYGGMAQRRRRRRRRDGACRLSCGPRHAALYRGAAGRCAAPAHGRCRPRANSQARSSGSSCARSRQRCRGRSRCGRAAEDGALLAREAATIAPDNNSVAVELSLPTELRNRVTRIEVEGEQSAGGVLLVDERWRRRPVGIAAPRTAPGSRS